MTNLDQKIFMSLNSSKKDKIINNIKMKHWIYSIWSSSNLYNIDYNKLVKRLKFLNKEKLIIFDIVVFKDQPKKIELLEEHLSYLPASKDNPYYLKITINISDFFKKENIDSLTKDIIFGNEIILNNSIFIFNSLPLPFIISAFKLSNILISAGSYTKRGLLSPVQLRLAQFNMCLEGIENNTIHDSYHHYDKLAIQPLFNHAILDKIEVFKNITTFFIALEHYYKSKLNNNTKWNLRDDNNINTFNLEEFIKLYSENYFDNSSNNNNDNII